MDRIHSHQVFYPEDIHPLDREGRGALSVPDSVEPTYQEKPDYSARKAGG